MNKYAISITFTSNTLIGSGESFAAIIDSDVVFDDCGIPFIPARRVKGCLKDSALEVINWLYNSGINSFVKKESITDVFGKPGSLRPAPVSFSNLVVEEYQDNKLWLNYLRKNYPEIISKDKVLSFFTEIHQQTAIDDGVAKDHSLRTIRVLTRGLTFWGDITIEDNKYINETVKILSLACLNLRHIGTKRNRGFGEVECKLWENHKEISVINGLEGLI